MTYYEILGVSKTASQEEIKSAYKSLIKRYHPDLYQGDKSFAEKKTQEINVAYDILSDVNKRAEYNLEINPTTATTQNYSYTPPKYSSTYNPYNSYNYRSKNTYTSNNYQQQYSNNTNTRSSSNIDFEQKLLANLVVVFGIFILYIAIFLGTFFQYKNYKRELTESKKNTTINNNTVNTTSIDDEPFDINDYYSDSELLEIYRKNYTDIFDNFKEFKEAYSAYIELYYNF